jgi:hypothetical protein
LILASLLLSQIQTTIFQHLAVLHHILHANNVYGVLELYFRCLQLDQFHSFMTGQLVWAAKSHQNGFVTQ